MKITPEYIKMLCECIECGKLVIRSGIWNMDWNYCNKCLTEMEKKGSD